MTPGAIYGGAPVFVVTSKSVVRFGIVVGSRVVLSSGHAIALDPSWTFLSKEEAERAAAMRALGG